MIQSEQFKDCAVFADELSIFNEKELQALKNTFELNSDRIIWIAITGMRQNKISPEKIKSEFESLNFYVPNLLNPLRNSTKIIEFAYPSIRGNLNLSYILNFHLVILVMINTKAEVCRKISDIRVIDEIIKNLHENKI